MYLASLDGGEPRLLIHEAERAVYSAPGYLLFVRGGTLVAQSFDLTSRQITGEAFPIPGPDGEVITTACGALFCFTERRPRLRQNPTADLSTQLVRPTGEGTRGDRRPGAVHQRRLVTGRKTRGGGPRGWTHLGAGARDRHRHTTLAQRFAGDPSLVS